MSEEKHDHATLATAYHTYTLDWYPDSVVWFLDGERIRANKGAQPKTLTNKQSFRFNFWAANIVSWVGRFDGSMVPYYMYVNWFKYYEYDEETKKMNTEPLIIDNFNTLRTSLWNKANWTFGENLVQFGEENSYTKEGYLVLTITRKGAKVSQIAPLKDQDSAQDNLGKDRINGQDLPDPKEPIDLEPTDVINGIDNQSIGSYEIYPNPSNGQSVNFNLPVNKIITISIIDLTGVNVYEKTFQNTTKQFTIDFTETLLKPGVYRVVYSVNNESVIRLLMIK